MPRPLPTFRDFIGQPQVVDFLKRQIAGALSHAEPCPHLQFNGPSGCGKTLLARAVAAELGGSLFEASGYDTPEELAIKCSKCQAGDVVFIDEFHTASEKAQELLYSIIDEGVLPDWAARAVALAAAAAQPAQPVQPSQAAVPIPSSGINTPAPINVQGITIIIATDQPNRLRNALQERMTVTIHLRPYSLPEMRGIVDRIASKLDILMSGQAANMVARAARGNPRRAKHHLLSLRRHVPAPTQRQLGKDDVLEYLHSAGIDADGLGIHHRWYLRQLQRIGHASLQTLALGLRMKADWVREEIEAPLFALGLVTIGNAGRELTPQGQLRIQATAPQKTTAKPQEITANSQGTNE